MEIALLLLAVQSAPSFGSDRFHELTIREIYAAKHPRPNWETSFFFAHPLGDHDRDGQMDFALAGVGGKPNFYTGQELIRLESGLQADHRRRHDQLYYSKFIPQQGNSQEGISLALLTAPTGPRIAVLDINAELTLWDLNTHAFLGIVPVPPPPVPGLPGADFLQYVSGDTDVDADGWNDLFFMSRNGGYGIVGLISGRTLQPLWQYLCRAPVQYIESIPHLDASRRPDFDRDSVPDFLYAFGNFWSGPESLLLGVISGATGALLWERASIGFGRGWATPVPDINSDGVPDVVMGFEKRALDSEVLVQGLDGATGGQIWTSTRGEVTSRIPALFATLFMTGATGWCQISPPGRSLGAHEIWITFAVDDGDPWTQTPRNVAMVLDTSDGGVLDTVIQPRELHPWRQLPPGDPRARAAWRLGDVDRDGLIEYAQPVAANDVNNPNIPGDPYHLVIYGQNTLLGPAEAVPGETLPLELWIPSAPGHEAWIVASTVLESEAGLELEGWRTRLGASALRSLTVLTRPGRTTLDAHGRASLTMRLPDWPRLSGEKLFLRAIVEQPGTGEIWTMSSLGVVPVR